MNANPETVRSPLEAATHRGGWATTIRGALAVVFGILALRSPGMAVSALVVIFAIYAFADGITDFGLALWFGRAGQRWGWYVFEGIVSIGLGIVALAYPGITLIGLVLFIGIRAILLGIFELIGAFAWKSLDSRWLLGLAGVVSILFGVLLLASPIAGALALVWTVGLYAVVIGVMLFAFGLRLLSASRGEAHLHHPPAAA